MQKRNFPRWVEDWALIIGTVIVLTVFVQYGFSVFYPSPQYNDFCSDQAIGKTLDTQSSCEDASGKWVMYEEPIQQKEVSSTGTAMTTVTGYCDQDFYCRQTYQTTQEHHDRNAFLAIVIIGGIIAILGFARVIKNVIGTAFSLGGILILLTGVVRFWGAANSYLQFVLLGIILILFIVIGIRRKTNDVKKD